ncbi:hypothetical protein [Rhodococcus sp. (in: high G+C Gram-positive bacteria)]|uniref:hypothetical protein n=1 Tax=Rhodococcus sp. TaxID=1831 RepID=UPI003B8A884F
MTSVTDLRADTIEPAEVLRQANRLWRRAGVRRSDRQLLLAELRTELDGARHDGHSLTTVLGQDSNQMLRSWAEEREVHGRAMRLGLTVSAALLGAVFGSAFVLLVLVTAFTRRSTLFDPGPFVLPFYASGAVPAFLCALLCVWGVLRWRSDPGAASTARWLIVLLPIGAASTTAATVSVAWWANFNTSPKVFTAVIALAVAGFTLTVGLARILVVRHAADRLRKRAASWLQKTQWSRVRPRTVRT